GRMESNPQEVRAQLASVDPVAVGGERALAIRFTGSGSEYFRIWIINLLLSIGSLGWYRPWAKVRRLKYFYGNTIVDEHALDFHGDPIRMLRGYLLVGAMAIVYSVAVRISPVATVVALGAVCVLWPALLRASMQFRLANTSWRGLRFKFSGDLGGAYAALLPLFGPGVVLVLMGLAIEDPEHPPAWYLKGMAAVLGVAALLVPLAWWKLKRYQHGHYAMGPMQTRLALGPGRLYALSLRVVLLFVASVFLVLAVTFTASVALGVAFGGSATEDPNATLWGVLTAVIGAAIWLAVLLVPVPYATSRLQNLVWSNTKADTLRFQSDLHFKALLGVTLKNWLLMLATLGLYTPFAAVATYRLRVESVTPKLQGDLAQLHQPARTRADDASGDAAGDLFGIDIGL
ncbi:MAG TPA: YjgN family protein, partial [Acetobacteraceae bacterium]|nr:YjgN family protein [Acetobacteraceae bacterium]